MLDSPESKMDFPIRFDLGLGCAWTWDLVLGLSINKASSPIKKI